MDIINNLKNKLQIFVAQKTNGDQDRSCPHCRVSPDSLKILKGKGEQKSPDEIVSRKTKEENCH